MKRYIKINRLDEITYEIIEQSHRDDFTPTGNFFVCSNGFKLHSSGWPEAQSDQVAMQGGDSDRDGNLLYFSTTDEVEKFLFAVKEYNKLYGDIFCKCNRAIVCKECMKDLEEVLNF